MKTVFVYIWDHNNKPFGFFTNKDEAEKALAAVVYDINISVESLKADLYYYEVPLNKFFLADYNIIIQ